MLNYIDGLLNTGPAPDPHREERQAKLAALRELVDGSLRPAMRRAARHHLHFLKAAAEARLIYVGLIEAGISVVIPETLRVSVDDVRAAAAEYVRAGLIDPADSVLDGITS